MKETLEPITDIKFEAIMTLIVPQVINLICEKDAVDEITASKRFYQKHRR